MAHIAIQVGNIGVEIEDEDMDAKDLSKLGQKVFGRLVNKLEEEKDEE